MKLKIDEKKIIKALKSEYNCYRYDEKMKYEIVLEQDEKVYLEDIANIIYESDCIVVDDDTICSKCGSDL